MIGSKLRQRMEETAMSQADLARRSGLSTGYVADLVNDNRGRRLSFRTVQVLCDALGVKPDFFSEPNSKLRGREAVGAER